MADLFFAALGLSRNDRKGIEKLAAEVEISKSRLVFYNDSNVLPTGSDMESINQCTGITEDVIKLRMGILDHSILKKLSQYSEEVNALIQPKQISDELVDEKKMHPVFSTKLGKLYHGDCMDVLKQLPSNSVDMVFADPPFNLNKLYPSKIDDNLKSEIYLEWCEEWIDECIRILKNNGSMLLWNLPKWNAMFSQHVGQRMTFKHWIAVDIKYRLPIKGRLYPSHYSLLYCVKGKTAATFHPDRLAMQVCPKCYGDLKDYGGYKSKMNPLGVNLTDVWLDIPPVRHRKYKRRNGANELSLKLMDRVIEMTTNKGDVVFDPFGGAGTTYMAAELKERRWIGCEIGPTDDIVNRFKLVEEEKKLLEKYREGLNKLFPEKVRKKRNNLNLWTCDTIDKKNQPQSTQQELFKKESFQTDSHRGIQSI